MPGGVLVTRIRMQARTLSSQGPIQDPGHQGGYDLSRRGRFLNTRRTSRQAPSARSRSLGKGAASTYLFDPKTACGSITVAFFGFHFELEYHEASSVSTLVSFGNICG